MTAKPAILVIEPHLAPVAALLEGDFTVWRLWQAPPIEASATIGAMLVAGEVPVDVTLAESLPRLGLIACFAAGFEGVDLAWAAERGLKVSHSPGVNQEDVADQAIAMMLAAWRGVLEGDAIVREGRWRPNEKRMALSLAGRRLGVVGLGPVGEAVARRAEAFGLEVAWWGEDDDPDAGWPRSSDLVALAASSDILIIAEAVAGAEIIGREVIDALGPEGLLVNVARGQLVDEDALIAALRDGRLGMAALDVFQTEPTPPERWAGVPNLVLSPHAGAATSGSLPKMVALTRENLRRFFAGEPLANAVLE